jgi:hypothetical protein
MRTPLVKRLSDPDAESVRRSTHEAITELQGLDRVKFLGRFTLPNGVGVLIPHGLGREPRQVLIGPPAGASSAGVIQDYRASSPSGAPNDLTKTISLRAISFGADIEVAISVVV